MMVCEVPLSRGLVALVDNEDYELVSAYRWYAVPRRRTYYAEVKVLRDGRRVTLRMHNLILGALWVDHRNGAGFDNRRGNLRLASRGENGRNRPAPSNNTSGYKGVSWHKHSGRWQGAVASAGTSRYLGLFDTPEEAARAYDAAARELHGEFAWLNFPRGVTW